MKTISERIKEGLQIRDMKQTDLVKLTGITKGALSSYISGTYEPKQRNIYKIAKALNVSETWLMGLDVKMERTSQPEIVNISSIKESQLISVFKQLNETGKDEAIKRVSELTEINKYTTYSPPLTVAAHDDDLTDAEKTLMDERINEALKKL